MKVTDKKENDSFRQIDRLVNFSDAVIAIAVTLLILPLAEDVTKYRTNSFHDLVSTSGSQFLIFLLSFVVICRFWLVHHNLFSPLRRFSPIIFWLNAAWLLTIVMIPFTSELIGNSNSGQSFITIIYIGTLVMTSCLDVAIQWAVMHSPELQKPSFSGSMDLVSGAGAAAAMIFALLLSIIFPGLGAWSLLVLLPGGFVTGYLQKRSARN